MVESFDNRHWQQLYYGRPHGCEPFLLGGETLQVTDSPPELVIGFHLCWIEHPIRVLGYHFAGLNFEIVDWRFWLHRADARTGLPVGPSIERMDTGVRTVGTASGDLMRNNVQSPSIHGPSAASDTQFVDLVLPNPVYIERPGLYWIGSARTALFLSSEGFFCSRHPGHVRGLRDMMSTYTESVELGELDPGDLTTINYDDPLSDQLFQFPGSSYEVDGFCNIDVALITERWWNG